MQLHKKVYAILQNKNTNNNHINKNLSVQQGSGEVSKGIDEPHVLVNPLYMKRKCMSI